MHNNRVGSVVDSKKTVFQGSDEMLRNTLLVVLPDSEAVRSLLEQSLFGQLVPHRGAWVSPQKSEFW